MHNCSKVFFWRFSNPNMSRIPMDKHWKQQTRHFIFPYKRIHNHVSRFVLSFGLNVWKVFDCQYCRLFNFAKQHFTVPWDLQRQILPCRVCWALHDWCERWSSQTEHCITIWPWSPSPWRPGRRNNQKQSEKSILASESPEHCVMWDYKKSIQIIHMKISGATK